MTKITVDGQGQFHVDRPMEEVRREVLAGMESGEPTELPLGFTDRYVILNLRDAAIVELRDDTQDPAQDHSVWQRSGAPGI